MNHKNLVTAHPENVKELRAKLNALLKSAVPPGNDVAGTEPKRKKRK